ncbi:surfeit locus protein 6-domain-containing protein [Cercophora samala]|uniref:Surfeit locus protein 6-domain-containing protein n=1 Tax=Cercophora samala TaxID=330535 RepID=A0AA39ZM18_9PEZI|nr:surfeit locus protein 6-domain-containing protein [Cercophora samala]
MADEELQERLRGNSQAFNSLLSLIPGPLYYGDEDTSNQWKRKKQTKEEARAAKRNKLDPDSERHRNAMDLMEEKARNKRKLKELEAEDDSNNSNDDDDDFEIEGIEKEKPLEGLKRKDTPAKEEEESPVKKQKVAEEEPAAEQAASKPASTKESKKSAKKQKKEEAKRLKMEAATPSKPAAKKDEEPAVQESTETPDSDREDDEMVAIDISGLVTKEEDNTSETTRDTPASEAAKTDSVAASSTTSISSAVPPSERPKALKTPVSAMDVAKLREKLNAKLLNMKIARKAADSEGNAIKNKEDLLESRRKLALKRKERKNEMRKQAKIEEEKKREAALATARDSPALSSFLQEDDNVETNFAFGRLAFSDGTQLSHDAAYEKTPGSAKKKGPSDPKTALLKLENQKKRIANLPEEKQKQVIEQEAWLAARKRAEGEKVIDSEALLKKAIKRKEKGKKKSEKEWKERKEGVQKSIYDRQKKREDNLQKRKDEKMANRRGKGKGKKTKGVQTKKKGGRPGFEGK